MRERFAGRPGLRDGVENNTSNLTNRTYNVPTVNWLRNRLRAWLGIDAIEARANEAITIADASIAKRNELNTALQQVNEVRELLQDPKRVPIRTTRSAQFRALMEAE